jgi:hypothetical protein
MSSKRSGLKKKENKTATTSTPATASNSKAPAAPAEKKRNIKAPIDRALKSAKLIDRHSRSLSRLVNNWTAEATEDQIEVNAEVKIYMGKIAGFAEKVLLDIDMLKKSGFTPTVNLRAALPLAAGTLVRLKEERYNKTMGASNAFEVVLSVEGTVRIRPLNDTHAPQTVVPRSWVEVVDSEEEEDEEKKEGEEDEDEDEDEDENEEGTETE